jgi:hypothetical protein
MPSPPKKRRDRDQEDEDNGITDKAPPLKKRSSRDDRDDDEDDDRSSSRKSVVKKGGSSMALIIGGILGGAVLLFGCCGVGALALFVTGERQEQHIKPKDGFVQIEQPPIVKDGVVKIDRPPNPNDKRPVDGKFKDLANKDIGKLPSRKGNTIAAPVVNLPLDANHDVKDIVFAEQASGVGFYYWKKGDVSKHFDYWDWKASQKRATITLPNMGTSFVNLSPQGTRLVAMTQGTSRKLLAWSLPDGKPIFTDWDPYAGIKAPNSGLALQTAWANFLDEDRLLVLSERGRFDIWSVSKKQMIYSNPRVTNLVHIAPFARSPQNFNLSPDRKRLAMLNATGTGFDCFDLTTGKLISVTEPIPGQGPFGNIWALAFDRSGTTLALKCNLSVKIVEKNVTQFKQQNAILAWDVGSGKKKWHHNVQDAIEASGPLTWLNNGKYLGVQDGNCFRMFIFGVNDGRFYRACMQKEVGLPLPFHLMARVPPDERLWYYSRSEYNTPGSLIAVDFPEFDITQNPAPAEQKNLRKLPNWTCEPFGIVKFLPQ